MTRFDKQKFSDAVNADPEFKIAARLWNARLRLRIGERAFILSFADGTLAAVNDQPTIFDEWDIDIAGPADGWEKLLQPVPPPLYQDIFPAQLHKGFSLGGNLELLFAYYPAVRRMFDIMRGVIAAAA